MKSRLSDERGNIIVTAMLLMAIMIGIGFSVAAQVDTQTSHSRTERERESSFNLAEAALSAQTFILGRRGTGTQSRPYPTQGCPGRRPVLLPGPRSADAQLRGRGPGRLRPGHRVEHTGDETTRTRSATRCASGRTTT